MTALLTVGGYLATWISRAGQAWGPNDVWNNGASWESMYGTSQTDLSNMTGSRDYWQHTVAHNDAGVWDNRYNAGYSAGNSAGYSAGNAAGLAANLPLGSGSTPSRVTGTLKTNDGNNAIPNYSDGVGGWALLQNGSSNNYRFRIGKSGSYVLYLHWSCNPGRTAQIQYSDNGGGSFSTLAQAYGASDNYANAVWEGFLTSNGTDTYQIRVNDSSNNTPYPFGLTPTFSFTFVPTPSYPH
jgi:hypothetical protein